MIVSRMNQMGNFGGIVSQDLGANQVGRQDVRRSHQDVAPPYASVKARSTLIRKDPVQECKNGRESVRKARDHVVQILFRIGAVAPFPGIDVQGAE